MLLLCWTKGSEDDGDDYSDDDGHSYDDDRDDYVDDYGDGDDDDGDDYVDDDGDDYVDDDGDGDDDDGAHLHDLVEQLVCFLQVHLGTKTQWRRHLFFLHWAASYNISTTLT